MSSLRKGNARGRAGVRVVVGGQAEAANLNTRKTGIYKSTRGKGVMERKSTATEVKRTKILALLRQGAKTTLDPRAHGILMPSTRVFELKKAGHIIQTELVALYGSHGFRHQKCARYSLLTGEGSRSVHSNFNHRKGK